VISAIERVQSNTPPVDLTPKNPEKLQELASLVGGEIILGQSVRLKSPGQISKIDGYDKGEWWVQDAAAALPVRLLGNIRGKTALDLCAAPGGKTLQLAAAGAEVTAVDISERRLKRLEENLQRTGMAAEVKAMDAFALRDVHYDVIVLDAPCSATGTLRRHPDLPYAKDGSEFANLIQLQQKMLRHAVNLLAPGGRLVYCTCSLLPDEGEAQIEDLISENTHITVDTATLLHTHIDPAWVVDGLGLRLRPDYLAEQGGMDGFFVSLLHKKV
ncbi:MAG: RsmB/NOP family class I SAM-dependent RNA methyltransferase, partial [Paracoccaceae bacterium]